jgi:hypothetical protein
VPRITSEFSVFECMNWADWMAQNLMQNDKFSWASGLAPSLSSGLSPSLVRRLTPKVVPKITIELVVCSWFSA